MRLALRLAAFVAAVALAAAVPALAAAGGSSTPTGTTTPQPAGTAEAEDDDDDDALVALGVLGFGALVLGMTLLYLDAWRRSSAELIKETLLETGELPEYESVSAKVPEEGVRGAPPVVPVTIRGPALLYAGRGSRFRAFRGDAAVSVDWAVEPADAARTEPVSGQETVVTPSRLGPLTVRAAAAGVSAELHAVVVAAPRRAGRVPLVGVGYGGLTIAIMALTLAGAATVYGKLDGAALVAIAGAIVGYFFVDARSRQGPEGGGGGGASREDAAPRSRDA